METKAVDNRRKKHKSSGKPKHHVKKHGASKGKKGGHKRHGTSGSKSKSKKKSGFMCCGKKKKHSKKKSKSKTTKKQPKRKIVKPLPPVPNEQLGEIVLVKNGSGPETPKKQEQATPEKDVLKPPKTDCGVKMNISKENIGSEKVEKKIIKEGSENEPNQSAIKSEGVVKKIKQKGKGKGTKVSDSGDELKNTESDKKLEKWKKLAKRIMDEDANVAINEFEQVASYIPTHVTKHHFVENMPKNRFADVICLDHSRVVLRDDAYIHASWVDLDTEKKAILTQLPLPETAADFWQMVIEQKVKCVLLILTDEEFNILGGNFVFPENQDFLSFEERSIRVGEFKQMELGPGWVLKVLSVTNGNYKAFIHVHHFKAWLHNSVPSDVKQVWQIQSYIRKYSSPPVFMSLSGCGRAGTFALLETAHLSLHSDQPSLEMRKCLESIRNGRLHCVQNITQFSFVYTLIAEHILGNGLSKKDDGEDAENSIQAILRQLTIQ